MYWYVPNLKNANINYSTKSNGIVKVIRCILPKHSNEINLNLLIVREQYFHCVGRIWYSITAAKDFDGKKYNSKLIGFN